MKLLNRQQIEALSQFKSRKFLTTSFFLDTDKSHLSRKEILVSAKNLINTGRTYIEALALDKERKASLVCDLDKIWESCERNMTSNSQGLAVFSACGEDFWQDVHLPHPPRNRVFFDHNPYIRPLSQILERFQRVGILLIARREARWYSLHMGELVPLDSLASDVPAKVKEGGFEGTSEKRIGRHVEAHLHEHFKKAALKTFELFKANQFDWLFLGCEDAFFADLELYLHRYLLDRLKGRLKARPGDPVDKVLKEAVELEHTIKAAAELDWVKSFVAEIEKGGRAVSGLRDSLRALNAREVQMLLVQHNFAAPGKTCPKCKFLYADEAVCPTCGILTEGRADIVDEGIEAAFREGAAVRHISPPSKLDHYGRIGALLRYKNK
jgi:peptide subunit release factor 1 (eRF1)